MGKLHELLAVLPTKEGAQNKLVEETKKTFGKETLFQGQVRSLKMYADELAFMNHEEHQELTTTVDEVLEYLEKPITSYWDNELQKEEANQRGKADLVINGVTVAKDLPAQFLLGMESKLVKLRQLYDKIPTLPPGIQWVEDSSAGMSGAFITVRDEVSFKTEKDPEFRVVVEATKEHPAQVERVDRTSTTGVYTTTKLCGKMQPAKKAKIISRIDTLLEAVKKARMRANNVEVVNDLKIGEALFRFINDGIV